MVILMVKWVWLNRSPTRSNKIEKQIINAYFYTVFRQSE